MTITLNDKIVAATLSLLADRDGDPVSEYGVIHYKPFRSDLNDDEAGALRQMVDVHDTGEFKAAVAYGHKIYREMERYKSYADYSAASVAYREGWTV